MKRYLEYQYKIGKVNKEALWIYIEDANNSGWGEEIFEFFSDAKDAGPVEFLLRIKDYNNWNIEKVGNLQYRFIEDSLNLIFQWDDLFGFIIQFEDWKQVDNVIRFLEDYLV